MSFPPPQASLEPLSSDVQASTRQGTVPRGRVLVMALGGVIPIALFVQWSDLLVGGTMVAGTFPPLAACLLWGVLLLVQRTLPLARNGSPLFTRGELLIILGIWLTANMVAGRGMLHPLLASLVGPVYYARSGVAQSAISKNLPDWLAVTDRAAARAFFEGNGTTVPWQVWIRPLGTWTLFFVPFLTANLCLCALFERVWVRHERLAFPLVALAIEISGQNDRAADTSASRPQDGQPQAFQMGRSLAQPLTTRIPFLFGLAFPLLLHGFGVAHAYLPAVPCVPFFNDLSSLLTEAPWTAMKPIHFNIYPLLIGLTFLAPADVTFGVWFFLLLNKAEMVFASVTGWNEGGGTGGATAIFPYAEEQSAGAYLALGGLLIWNARRHFLEVDRRLALGFVVGLAGTLGWCVWTGLPFWFAAGYIGFYLLVALVLSRLMAEGGIAWTLAPILPDKLLLSLTGSAALPPLALTRLTLYMQHLRDTRQMLAPAAFQAGKLRDEAAIAPVWFYGMLLVSLLVALAVGVGTALPILYNHGALSLLPNSDGLTMSAQVIPSTAVGQLSQRLLTPVKPSPGAAGALVFGAGAAWLLSVLRLRFLWWPLHPLGYALTGTLQTGYASKMLFSIFAGWAAKTLCLRFGGTGGFRLLRGAALGLILGDLLMGAVIKVLDALLGPGGYAIF